MIDISILKNPPCQYLSEGQQYRVSIQSFVNLEEAILQITNYYGEL